MALQHVGGPLRHCSGHRGISPEASINLNHVRAFANVKSALTQSLPIKRPQGPIYAEPCEGLQLGADTLLEILLPVYGLDDVPAAWRETVTQYLTQEAGFIRNLVEPCWFSKFPHQGPASPRCWWRLTI